MNNGQNKTNQPEGKALQVTPYAQNSSVYLDANATEPVRPEALEKMLEVCQVVGNPSSIHKAGRHARSFLENAREMLASCFNGTPENCIFTSGGTESNVLAMHALGHGKKLLIGATEHPAIKSFSSYAHTVPVLPNGVLNLEALEEKLASITQNASPGIGQEGVLVCVMWANNETGVINPVGDIACICQKYGALLHVDAVQAAGRLLIDFAKSGADSMAVSAHKMGGIKGAGALFLKAAGYRQATPLLPLFAGGGQEEGRRGGTPPLAVIAAMAAAAEQAVSMLDSYQVRLAPLRSALENAAETAGAEIAGKNTARLVNTVGLILPERSGALQLMYLDTVGVCVSSGAACSSGKVSRSHVLEAMGYMAAAGQAIRVSLPWNVTEGDVARFIKHYEEMVKNFQKRGEHAAHLS